MVRLSGELNDITFDEAQDELLPLLKTGPLHWRVDLKDLSLKNAGASFLCALGAQLYKQGGGCVLLNVNPRHQQRLDRLAISRFLIIEAVDPQREAKHPQTMAEGLAPQKNTLTVEPIEKPPV